MPLQQSQLQSHTGQGLAGRGGCRGSHSRVLQITEFVSSTGSLGFDVVHHGSYTAPANLSAGLFLTTAHTHDISVPLTLSGENILGVLTIERESPSQPV